MARNGKCKDYYSNRNKILRVSHKLFLENGYDNTTIKDIIDNLDGLTKGALYYYFESKQDILENIILDDSLLDKKSLADGENMLKKLRNSIIESLDIIHVESQINAAPIVLKSPSMIGQRYLELYELKDFFVSCVKEGIEEGSIITEYPEEIVELVLMYVYLYTNLNLHQLTKLEYLRKMTFIKEVFQKMGVPVIDNEVLLKSSELYDNWRENHTKD